MMDRNLQAKLGIKVDQTGRSLQNIKKNSGQGLTQPLFMRGLLRPMFKMILNAGSTGRQSCFCYSNLINMPGHTRTAKFDVMVMLKTSNCSCNILEMRPSFDA